jgi:hypothetical protein
VDYDWALEQISLGFPVKRSFWNYVIKQDHHGDLHVCTPLTFLKLSDDTWSATEEDERAHDWARGDDVSIKLVGDLPTKEQLKRAVEEGARHVFLFKQNNPPSISYSNTRFKK